MSVYESVCAGHCASGLWYELGSYSRLSYVDMVCLVKQAQGMISMSKANQKLPSLVPAMSHELLLGAIGADWSLEIWILEVYRWLSVLWGIDVLVWNLLIMFGALHVIQLHWHAWCKQHIVR